MVRPLPPPQIVENRFDDIDALAASALAWDQHYEQIGRGRFEGRLTQFLMGDVQLGRESWSPGVLQRGCAPAGTWVFGLPLFAEGSLHIRRRPAPPGQLLVATSRDDVGFTATGPSALMIVVLPTQSIDHWVQVRRGIERLDVDLPSPRWQVPATEMARRAETLSGLLEVLTTESDDLFGERSLRNVESQIFEVILGMIPSAEVIEPLHSRARIARAVLSLLRERLNDPPSITELCVLVGARERTLYLSCLEAFGRPPATLLAELRLNAAHRSLLHPEKDISVTAVAVRYGFTHFGRFAAAYRHQFGELPSVTFAKTRGSRAGTRE
ncbi:helix-turn-helix domain-containing protein [Rhizobium mongolense]|uniref:AraC family ethanolamine operon transcriptional activator n=1 Tax=Rhizobium mongolense TaxID=57676 RepID=A0A7W6WD78_9HYPH|nr:helix-turn-helix domain-containing protein [Rhizobium mongolense]MBB4274087.1 AraC family ethanolamine operon transcriptional activator [Rhizobium mongolense]